MFFCETSFFGMIFPFLGGGGVSPPLVKKFAYPVQFLHFQFPLDSTTIVNGKEPLPSDDNSSAEKPSSSLLFQHPDTDSNLPKQGERAISFGYIDSLLPLDENVSAPTKTISKSKNKTTSSKTKVIPKTKLSPEVEVAKQIDDVDPNPHSIPIPDSNKIEKTAALTLIQIVKLENLGLGLGPVALDTSGKLIVT